MKQLTNERGIALVTSLMLTLISLTIVMALLYIMTKGIQVSGSHMRYKTAREATYGGSAVVVEEIIPLVMQGNSGTTIANQFSSLNMSTTSDTCLQSKLRDPTSQWPASCSQTLDPKKTPDIQLTLQSTQSGQPFNVYSKIVDTVQGNSDTSGLQLEGSGVAEASSVVTVQHFPYVYRIEVQGERQQNPTEQANVSVLYAY